MGSATSMPNIWLFFSGYLWIDIVHDSEGSLIMYHGLFMKLYYTTLQILDPYDYSTYFMEFIHIVS